MVSRSVPRSKGKQVLREEVKVESGNEVPCRRHSGKYPCLSRSDGKQGLSEQVKVESGKWKCGSIDTYKQNKSHCRCKNLGVDNTTFYSIIKIHPHRRVYIK